MAGIQANVYAGFSVVWALAWLSMIGRVIARRMTKVVWWYEDYFCFSAFIFACTYNSLCLYWCSNWYLGKKIPDTVDSATRDHILEMSRKVAFFCSITYAYSIASSKLAILSLYWRLFKFSSIRIPIITLLIVVSLWAILRTFMIIFRCIPVRAYWDYTIPNGHCGISDSGFFFGTMLPHFIMDVVILTLPVVEVFKLRLRWGQKIAIAALFLLGIVVCIASVNCLIISIKANPRTTQMPYDYALNYTWGGVEVNMAVVSSCFPLLRPIFRAIFGSRALSSYTNHGVSGVSGVSYGNHAYAETPGMEMSGLSKVRRKKEVDLTSSMQGLADEEKGILGDPATIKPPGRIFTSVTTPNNGSGWHEQYDNSIHVRNDVVVEVHKADAKSFSSDHTSQNSAR